MLPAFFFEKFIGAKWAKKLKKVFWRLSENDMKSLEYPETDIIFQSMTKEKPWKAVEKPVDNVNN